MLILASGLEKRTARQALRMSQFVRRREWLSPLVVSIALVKGRRVPFWDLDEHYQSEEAGRPPQASVRFS